MCRVVYPNAPVALWGGVYGNAKVVHGEDAHVVTADGKRFNIEP